jgi:hypothetical protein
MTEDSHLSCQAFSAQIAERFHPTVSTRAANRSPRLMHFHYQPAQHAQSLTKEYKQKRILLCNNMLEHPSDVAQKITRGIASAIQMCKLNSVVIFDQNICGPKLRDLQFSHSFEQLMDFL